MSDLGTVPAGLAKRAGSEVFWALIMSEVAVNPMTGDFAIVFPLVNGVMTMEVRNVGDHGTGSDLSGS